MCQSWQTMRPPAAWTASVTGFQPSTWASVQMPGALGQPSPFAADPGRLADDQPGACALAVVFGHHRVGHKARVGAAARQRGHQDAVRRLDGAG
jgi:hypothetical protein